MKQLIRLLLFITLVFSCSSEEEQLPGDTTSAVIWTGSNKTFSKADGADHTLINNQDVLTSNVSITRANNGGQIFNITREDSADENSSPAGTVWSIGNINNVDNLTFTNFRAAVGKPKDVVGKNLIMHLIDDNIYLSVKFTSWSQGKQGGFAYERSTP